MVDGMLVIDIHNHLGEATQPFAGSFFDTAGQTPSELIARMDTNGIDIAVVSPTTSGMLTHEDFRERNDYVLDAVYTYPERLVGFCAVTPLHGTFALEEVRRCVERGMIGIWLNPLKQGGYPLNHSVLDPLMHLARDLDLAVFTPTDFNIYICTPYQARILALRHPDVTLFMGHYGMDPAAVHWIPEVIRDTPNLFLDSSCTPDMPQAVYNDVCETVGAERIVFGSDTPDLSPEVALRKLQVAEELYGLSKADTQKILGENLTNLLKLAL